MEKYEKPNMEVVEVQNDVVTASCNSDVTGCAGTFNYGGGCSYGNPR